MSKYLYETSQIWNVAQKMKKYFWFQRPPFKETWQWYWNERETMSDVTMQLYSLVLSLYIYKTLLQSLVCFILECIHFKRYQSMALCQSIVPEGCGYIDTTSHVWQLGSLTIILPPEKRQYWSNMVYSIVQT